MKRLVLVDGSAYFYRAFWAIRRLATSKGMPTNAVFGFASMLQRVLKTYEGDEIVMVFDAPGPTFRHEAYPDYKATREEIPEDLVKQLPYVKALPPAYGLPTLEIAGVEADDVMGTLARRGAEAGRDVVIVTGDKDLMQLVTKEADDPTPGVILFDEMKGKRIGIREVKEKFGVPPDRVADVQALAGDPTDNIPGVKGIGEKTGSALIAEFGSLDALYSNLEKVKREATRGSLREHREEAFLSHRLATIRTDLELRTDLERRAPDRDALVRLYTELEFRRFLDEVEADRPKQTALSPDRYRLVLTKDDLRGVVRKLEKRRRLSVDLETDSPDPMRARLVGISLCAEAGEACYIPVGHRYLGAPEQLDPERVLSALKPLLGNPEIEKIGQNIKYDALVLRRLGVRVGPIAFDTMVGAYLVDPDGGPFNLDTLSRRWLNHETISYAEVTGKGKNQVTFDQVPLDRARDYACEDADVAFRLTPLLEERLRTDGVEKILAVELPLIEVLLRMEQNGVRVEREFLRELGSDFDRRLLDLRRAALREAGEEFNLDSPKQLQRILFEKLGLRRGRKTKTGYSTDVGVLEQLAQDHPLPARLLEYRTIAKLRNTYVDALPALIHPETGRIHTSYNQAIAATGRLTSSDPNLQNIPVRTAEGREIRKAFVPEEGWSLISADYSQVELRIVAHLSEDEGLIAAFRSGRDIHQATAAEVFGVREVTSELRRRAKEINFGILYGISAFGLAQRLRIEPATAQEYINLYFARYRRLKEYLGETLEGARRRGYVTTLFGRRRYVREINSKNRMIRGGAERIAVNAPVQGTAADLIKIAMIRLQDRLDREGLSSKLILQVHDELVLEAPEREVDLAMRVVREEMEGAFELRVPLRVDIGSGQNWADLK